MKIEDCGLRIADWGLRIEDWGMRIADQKVSLQITPPALSHFSWKTRGGGLSGVMPCDWGLRIADQKVLLQIPPPPRLVPFFLEKKGDYLEWCLLIEDWGLRIEDWGLRIADWGLRIFFFLVTEKIIFSFQKFCWGAENSADPQNCPKIEFLGQKFDF